MTAHRALAVQAVGMAERGASGAVGDAGGETAGDAVGDGADDAVGGAAGDTADGAAGDRAQGAVGDPRESAQGDTAADGHAESMARGPAAMCYILVALVPIGLVLGPVGTLIIWRTRRQEPFVDAHGRQALDIFLSALLLGGALAVSAHVTGAAWFEWVAYVVAGVYLLLSVVGAVLASRGRRANAPLTVPFLRRARYQGL